MAWKECSPMDQKLKFIARLIEGEKMAPLCREFGITRTTGYKIWNRYKKMGEMALVEQKRTPHRYANSLPVEVEALILTEMSGKRHSRSSRVGTGKTRSGS